jgi:hypothetical protein
VSDAPLVAAVLPQLAGRIEAALRGQGEDRLADQVATLRITAVCPCDQPFCGSFHTLTRPFKRWFIRGRQVEIHDDGPGEIVVDVVRGEIAYVEVLHLEDVRSTLARLPGP